MEVCLCDDGVICGVPYWCGALMDGQSAAAKVIINCQRCAIEGRSNNHSARGDGEQSLRQGKRGKCQQVTNCGEGGSVQKKRQRPRRRCREGSCF